MVRIGLISDTHSYLDERVFTYFKDCDEIWHAGDIGDVRIIESLGAFKTCRFVFGNIDGQEIRHLISEHLVFNIEDRKVLLTHIAGKFGSYNNAVRPILLNEKPDIIVCGHSHILKVAFDAKYNLLYINPGAAGISGFHKIQTLVRMNIVGNRIEDMEIIELSRRHIKSDREPY